MWWSNYWRIEIKNNCCFFSFEKRKLRVELRLRGQQSGLRHCWPSLIVNDFDNGGHSNKEDVAISCQIWIIFSSIFNALLLPHFVLHYWIPKFFLRMNHFALLTLLELGGWAMHWEFFSILLQSRHCQIIRLC